MSGQLPRHAGLCTSQMVSIVSFPHGEATTTTSYLFGRVCVKMLADDFIPIPFQNAPAF